MVTGLCDKRDKHIVAEICEKICSNYSFFHNFINYLLYFNNIFTKIINLWSFWSSNFKNIIKITEKRLFSALQYLVSMN